jgi:NADH-quinone oxidoreductase subunit G
MPKLIVDGQTVEVPQGTKVIEAAERLGIMIPRFCYHPGLGAVGACRLCAVKFLEGPVKGLEMSCMTEARDGMVVSTTHPEAVEFRKYIIEWLMLNHPHDCPVCDEGGRCLLQDETVSGGQGLRRYQGLKRTYRDQHLGVFVQHEMNRCIHCWRCRRFYQEFAGYRDFGALQIGNRMYFGGFRDGPLESPFSGNIIDLCPTGVLTDKPARYKGRRWDLERAPSLCLHCSLGCNITGSARYREMVRVEARFNDAVNGYFICDRGRFGFYYANHPERPRKARLGDREIPVTAAVEAAARKLAQIGREHGPGAIAALGSPRGSLETMGVLTWLCRQQGWLGPQFFAGRILEGKVKAAVSRLDAGVAVSLRDLEKSDFLVVAGADPVNEAPMLTLALRQARRQGATVAVIDPRPVFLPLEFEHLPAAPGSINHCLNLLSQVAVGRQADGGVLPPEAARFYSRLRYTYPLDLHLQDRLTALGLKLQDCRNPAIICNTDMVRESTPVLAADHARPLQAAKGRCGLFYLLPGPNAFAAALLTAPGGPSFPEFEDILTAVEEGRVRALVCVETDPFFHFADRSKLLETLGRLELLLVMDYLPSLLVQQAHIFLPTITHFEDSDSRFINQEGRLQQASPIHAGGLPISQAGGGSHPPRVFQDHIPGGEAKWAGDLLAALAANLAGTEQVLTRQDFRGWLARQYPVLARAREAAAPPEGIGMLSEADSTYAYSRPDEAGGGAVPGDQLELLLADWTFGTEELSGYSRPIQEVEREPSLSMAAGDASRLGLAAGDRVTLMLEAEAISLELEAVENMASGVMVLPRHRCVNWRQFSDGPVFVPITRISKG